MPLMSKSMLGTSGENLNISLNANQIAMLAVLLIGFAFLYLSLIHIFASASRINEVFELTSDIVDGEYDREESNKENMVIFDEVGMSYSDVYKRQGKHRLFLNILLFGKLLFPIEIRFFQTRLIVLG